MVGMHRSLIAGNDIADIYEGNEEHVTGGWDKDEDGVWDVVYKFPRGLMWKDGDLWDNRGLDTRVTRSKPEVRDYRNVGLTPSIAFPDVDEFTADYSGWAEQALSDGSFIVTADGGKAGDFTWYIDPGLNVSRVEQLVDGHKISVDLEYEIIGGVNVPTSAVFTAILPSGEELNQGSIVLSKAVVNDPALPDSLTPDYIGVETQMRISDHRTDPPQSLIYAGDGRLLPILTVTKKYVRRPDWLIGPKMKASLRKEPLPIDTPDARDVKIRMKELRTIRALSEGPSDAWDVYVAKFIKKYKLGEPRVDKSNQFLNDAKRLRARILKRYTPKGEYRNTAETIKQCVKEIDVVFERLKRRLDGLLTKKELKGS